MPITTSAKTRALTRMGRFRGRGIIAEKFASTRRLEGRDSFLDAKASLVRPVQPSESVPAVP